jgi:hypothetical protein
VGLRGRSSIGFGFGFGVRYFGCFDSVGFRSPGTAAGAAPVICASNAATTVAAAGTGPATVQRTSV